MCSQNQNNEKTVFKHISEEEDTREKGRPGTEMGLLFFFLVLRHLSVMKRGFSFTLSLCVGQLRFS